MINYTHLVSMNNFLAKKHSTVYDGMIEGMNEYIPIDLDLDLVCKSNKHT